MTIFDHLLTKYFFSYYTAARKAKMKPNNSSSGEIVTLKPDIGPPVVYRLFTRPPLAGPFAFSNIPTPAWNHPRVFLEQDIADTWLFNNYSVGYVVYLLSPKRL